MKVLLLNGSPRANGNTAAALAEMKAIFDQEGIEAEIVQVGHLPVRGCIACGGCYKAGKCVFDDVVNPGKHTNENFYHKLNDKLQLLCYTNPRNQEQHLRKEPHHEELRLCL